MRYSPAIQRLGALGADNWTLYYRAQAALAEGRDVVDLTIGAPDVPTPDYLIEGARASLAAGRTHYAPGAGEPALREALAARYTTSLGRPVSTDEILCLPGTQTGLYTVMAALAGEGGEVVVGDPMYATYGIVAAAAGARLVPVPLDPANGFRIRPDDIAARITDATRVIFLNTPHNPTGAVLTRDDIRAIGALARAHDLWIMCDEVYDEMVFSGATFRSPLMEAELAERTVVISSISKSHAAPGFRSGWCVGPAEFVSRAVPFSNAVLFGSPPFIADATARAVREPSAAARAMSARFERRAHQLAETLGARSPYRVHVPDAGMFALVDISASRRDGEAYALDLLDAADVAVMPGGAFGPALEDWVRVALTVSDARLDEGVTRMCEHAGVGA